MGFAQVKSPLRRTSEASPPSARSGPASIRACWDPKESYAFTLEDFQDGRLRSGRGLDRVRMKIIVSLVGED